eukprot:364267-Chlamydomonas_euryale.AAC.3
MPSLRNLSLERGVANSLPPPAGRVQRLCAAPLLCLLFHQDVRPCAFTCNGQTASAAPRSVGCDALPSTVRSSAASKQPVPVVLFGGDPPCPSPPSFPLPRLPSHAVPVPHRPRRRRRRQADDPACAAARRVLYRLRLLPSIKALPIRAPPITRSPAQHPFASKTKDAATSERSSARGGHDPPAWTGSRCSWVPRRRAHSLQAEASLS